MSSEMSLRDLCDDGVLFVTDGYRTRRDQLAVGGVPILRVAHVRDGFIEVDKTDRISRDFAPRFAQKTSRVDDVVITTKGTVGRAARIPKRFAGYVYSPQVCVLRVLDREVLDPAWLYCWARSPEFRNQLDLHSGQTDMAPYVKLKDLLGFGMTVPPTEQQRAIAEVLGALDDRLAWCAAGVELAYGLQDALFAELNARQELSRQPLSDFVQLDKGVSYRGADVTDDPSALPLINLGNFGRGRAPRWEKLKHYTGETRPRHHVSPGDVVVCATDMTHDRIVLGKALVVPERLTDAAISHHLYALRFRPETPVSPWLVALALSHEPIRRVVASFANGTTVLALPRDAVHRVQMPVPSPEQLATFDASVAGLQAAIESANDEAASLRRFRDALLPRLLSGELRIEDPERVLGAVA